VILDGYSVKKERFLAAYYRLVEPHLGAYPNFQTVSRSSTLAIWE
jgi:hypothetical protein